MKFDLSKFSYEDFINLFLELRENIPAIVEDVYVIIDRAARVLRTLGELVPESEALFMPSAEALALEGQLAEAYSGETGALFSGEGLRKLFKLVKDNPKLMEILLSLLLKTAAVKASEPEAMPEAPAA